VEALIQLAQHPDAVGEVLNVGNNEEITIEELARLVKQMAHSPSEIHYVPYGEAYEEGFEDMRRRVPDLSKIQQLLGYHPTRSIRGTVQDVIDYFQRDLS